MHEQNLINTGLQPGVLGLVSRLNRFNGLPNVSQPDQTVKNGFRCHTLSNTGLKPGVNESAVVVLGRSLFNRTRWLLKKKRYPEIIVRR